MALDRLIAYATVALVTALAGDARAQLFVCTAPSGRTITADRPPPECADRPIRELRPDGSVRRLIEPPLTPEQRELYGKAFDTFATTLNSMQSSGLESVLAARRVIELAEQVPPASRGAVGADAEKILRLVREKSDAELDAMRLHVVGLE